MPPIFIKIILRIVLVGVHTIRILTAGTMATEQIITKGKQIWREMLLMFLSYLFFIIWKRHRKVWRIMCQYKKSIYNILIPSGDKTYLWNTFSGAFLSLNHEGKTFYDGYDGKTSQSPFFRTLLEQGCIVDTRLD